MKVVPNLASVESRLQALRLEVEALATTLASVALPIAPEEITKDGQRVWHDSRVARVHTIDGGVFISGRRDWMTFPDWTALRPDEARRLASALLAAAADIPPDLSVVREAPRTARDEEMW